VLALASLFAFGCGSSSKATQQDAAVAHDGPGQSDAPIQRDGARDAAQATCDLPTDLGALGALTGDVFLASDATPSEYFVYDAALDTNTTPNLFEIEFYAGSGVFTSGIAPGTYTISDKELNYATCGLCVKLLGKVDLTTFNVDQIYMATGGTVTLTSVTGTLTGSFTNLTFEHVDIDSTTFVSTPLNDGCSSQTASGTFTAPIPVPDGGVPPTDAAPTD
jgi:hypothetical protein